MIGIRDTKKKDEFKMKNYVILLAGGTGSRMKDAADCPKQYIIVNDKPIILYALEVCEQCESIHGVIIVSDKNWQKFIKKHSEKNAISKIIGFAEAGKTRQLSIYHGLIALKRYAKETDVVIIHDAARPLVGMETINKCISMNQNYDGVMPCIEMKDTIYKSKDGVVVSELLKRDELFAGQAPESFKYGKYLKVHEKYSEKELENFSGSAEIAYANGLSIRIIEGEESNFKITTKEDLERFITIKQRGIKK
ncbi:2-C-methyl-D-erythritol 4-phosphate cytidylyltransferase [Lachnospiraceae bacterium OttesenSCG-928-D06]|nr:2-C-methyl-D-erythritol 4-phosphate cytidylyltransferase [Lachnospiraceae bacterium OttesenSCG-928-D06]